MQRPTPRQLQILRVIREYQDNLGYSPTFQEIGDRLGLTKVTVFEHVASLERKGIVIRGSKHTARCLQISPEFHFPGESDRAIPLAGRIAAGSPIEAVEDNLAVNLGDMFRQSGEIFALQVAGQSMIDEQIRDGDYVICRKADSARNGQTVVALLGDGEATLKKFYREKGAVRLAPANPQHEPIYAREVKIQGIVIGVVRKM